MAMTLRLSNDEDTALAETAAREHRSKQEVVHLAIAEYVSRRTKRRDELLAKIARENAVAFKRLADS